MSYCDFIITIIKHKIDIEKQNYYPILSNLAYNPTLNFSLKYIYQMYEIIVTNDRLKAGSKGVN